MKVGDRAELLARAGAGAVGLLDRRQQQRPALDEEFVQDLVLGAEVVVDEPVGDPRLVGDVGDAGRVEALAGEDADGGVEDEAALVGGRRLGHQRALRRLRPGVGARAAVGERGQRLADAVLRAKSSSAATKHSSSGGGGEHHAPGVDDRRAAEGAVVRRRLADLVGGEDEELVLDRPRPQQHFPVVAAGGEGEGRGDGDQPGAAQGEDPEELGEAEVVTDGQAGGQVADRRRDRLRCPAARARTRGRRRRRRRRRTCGSCGRRRGPRRRGRSGPRCSRPSRPRPRARRCCRRAGGCRARAPSRGRRGQARAVERLGPGDQFLAAGRAGSTSPAGRRIPRRQRPPPAPGARPRPGSAPCRRSSSAVPPLRAPPGLLR